ncbi:hypothetical protein D6850_05390 [Roseovarius spongiae]|uniref:Uncharacterized protein n=1 Tax=Roseovarius spongiae TaxID=2320272 RepID=A0A3A8B4X3_9RHOB|nr:hypothetical protein [Roseovarius spongiae]RKF16961.1 hypothetical protein D6850_05390 [Roseovarius spongiae]
MALVVAPGMASASQPISESFVQCAQLYDLSNRYDPSRRSTEKGAMLEQAAAKFMTGAQSEARKEGRSDVSEYLAHMAETKAADWDAKGRSYVFTQDFRDWMSYCRSLARSRGIKLRP